MAGKRGRGGALFWTSSVWRWGCIVGVRGFWCLREEVVRRLEVLYKTVVVDSIGRALGDVEVADESLKIS
jgi:hypothetical protein